MPVVLVNAPPATTSLATRLDPKALARMYASWRDDPAAVDAGWAAFFEGFELGRTRVEGGSDAGDALPGRLREVIAWCREHGHEIAATDPLAAAADGWLEQITGGFEAGEAGRTVAVPDFAGGAAMTVADVLETVRLAYAGSIGFEFSHLRDEGARAWVAARAEARAGVAAPDSELAGRMLRWLLEAEAFEQFLGRRFIGEKRFSLEGAEGVMVVLNSLLEGCPAAGVGEIEMGMSHRGRLNVLANFVRKTLTTILYEFTASYAPDLPGGHGDVKYHLGYENLRDLADGRVRVNLASNPSHLEAVDAIVEGRARARQEVLERDGVADSRRRVLPLLMHGDGAFAGQGVVAEVLNLSRLDGYATGGTIHVVINNRIGFTTTPDDARSSRYATDVAKMVDAPVLHVNGEDPAALRWAAGFALDFRQKFGCDVVIDVVCYRRQGHNESDQAAFTQPVEALRIAARESVGQQYRRQLIAAGWLEEDEAEGIEETIWGKLEAGYHRMMEMSEAGDRSAFAGSTAITQPPYSHAPVATGIDEETFARIAAEITRVPEGFTPHPVLERRWLAARRRTLEGGAPGIDWATAEALATGAYLLDGVSVRVSGQDSERGTFSQRHAVWHDHETRARHVPLAGLESGGARFRVHNSPLSQAAVLGFDYGYAAGDAATLVMWEAQFGDFANGAQTVIDQFIASGESKWQTPNDLVLLLPHGHEGMGPEHSSARLERFLQLCADDNLIVANCTTPAQYFHLLRRQKRREFRKPLVLMAPKGLMFRKEAVSPVADFLGSACFQEMLPDTAATTDPAAATRVICCSGKVYYDLLAHRAAFGAHDTAILRVEQIHPFHAELLEALLAFHPQARDFVWCQEEPENMGAWSHLAPQLARVAGAPFRYAGRPAAASPATGARAVHFREQKALIAHAFGTEV